MKLYKCDFQLEIHVKDKVCPTHSLIKGIIRVKPKNYPRDGCPKNPKK
jgi:hypothetical protein